MSNGNPVPRTPSRPGRKRPRRWLPLLLGLVLAAVLALLAVLMRGLGGDPTYTSRNSDGTASVTVRYRKKDQLLYSDSTGDFAYPAAGKPKFQWQTDQCCAVTYLSTDGSTRVCLLDGSGGQADKLTADPPTGRWRSLDNADPSVTLRWDEAIPGYRLQNSEGETLFRQWEDFDGLGLALCGDDGLPAYTLTASAMLWPLADDPLHRISTLTLCPVSMEDDTIPLVLCDADQDLDVTDAGIPELAPLPFSRTIDACVNLDGVFFTWDGGLTARRALSARDCARYGITDKADLEPVVLRWDVASFLTEEDGQLWSNTTRDQGQNWQVDHLADFTGATLDYRCLGFTGPGMGYAALSGTEADGTRRVELYTGLHHGLGWEAIQVPRAADGLLRPINGLAFYDGACAVATAPGDDGDPWPYVFVTMDCGDSWKQIDVPFAESGQTGATGLSALYFDGVDWQIVFTTAPTGTREIVFETATLTNTDWTFAGAYALS